VFGACATRGTKPTQSNATPRTHIDRLALLAPLGLVASGLQEEVEARAWRVDLDLAATLTFVADQACLPGAIHAMTATNNVISRSKDLLNGIMVTMGRAGVRFGPEIVESS